MDKKPALPTIPQASIPQFGRIDGGLLHGWSFGLAGVEVRGRSVHLVVLATPPNWCFPDAVRLDPTTDFKTLLPGPAAVIHDARKLIARAVEAERYGWNE